MSKENLRQFSLLVLSNADLRDQLKDLTESDEFISKVIELGAKSGFQISPEDIGLQMRENRRLWRERWM